MNKKKSGKKSIKVASKKAVHLIKKPSKSAIHIKPKSQKAPKKAIPKKTLPQKKPKEIIRSRKKKNLTQKTGKKIIPKKTLHQKKLSAIPLKQKKENLQQKKNEKPQILPAGHGIEIQKIEEEFNSLKALLKEKRKSGVDTLIEELKLSMIPPKIHLLKIEFRESDSEKIISAFAEIRESLKTAKPELTELDLPVVEENPKNPFESMKDSSEEHSLAEDAKNYRTELRKKGISFSGIIDSFSNLFKKRGGK